MMMNCMNTGTGALMIGGIRLADAALAMTVLLLALLAAIAAIAAVRFCFDVVRRFGTRPSRSTQASSGGRLASALWSFDWPASTTPLPQAAFLTSLFFARCGDERRQRDRRAYRRKAGPGFLIT